MLGPSSLRICLAAMAPALTEAATARLKLQDTSVTTESLSLKLESKSTDSNISVLRGSCQLIGGDLNAAVCRLVTQGDRSTHLSHTTDRAHFQAGRSATACDNGRNLNFPGSSSTGLKSLNVHPPHIDSNIVCEGGVSSRTNQFIDNLKIMYQTPIDANKQVEQSKVELGSHGLAGSLIISGSNTKARSTVMVSADDERNRKDASEHVLSSTLEKNLHAKFEKQLLEEKRAYFTVSSAQTLNSDSGKMGICVQNTQSHSNSVFEGTSKSDAQMDEKSKDDLRKDCVKKQAYLERRVDTLLRRLKRMKGKVVEAHTKEQLKSFVSFQHKNLQKVAKTIKNEAPGPEELKEHFLSNEEVKNMSTAQLVKLVKTYQPNPTAVASGAVATHLGLTNSSSVMMDLTLRNQSLKTFERLAQRVQTSGAELDSDATASSSGGESGDEDSVSSSHHPADLPPLLKRAEWKWAVDRAAVVARWTWLQAQVSDLEYRIRQQSQIHRQLRNSKGGVVLGDQPTAVEILRRLQGIPSRQSGTVGSETKSSGDGSPGSDMSPCNISSVMSNVDKQASRLTHSLGNCLSPSSAFGSPASSSKISSPFVNGPTDSPSNSTTTGETTAENSPSVSTDFRHIEKASDLIESISADATCQSARCRPLRSYRKRKILRTIGLYKTSLKAARLSDLRCRCYSPSSPCPICGGRYNNTLTIDPDTMSFRERVAILDPSFHPVLSFSHDINLAIHCEGVLKSGLWQNKPPPRRSRVGEYRRQKVITLVTEPVKKTGNNRQNGRSNNPASVIHFSTKIKNKYETKKAKAAAGSKRAAVKPRVNKVKRKLARELMKKNLPDEEEEDLEALYVEQEFSAPGGLTGSSSQTSLKDMRDGHQRKRRVDNSFDINNIVIPLSMAASTRVEQPQYKEIVTPKWREICEHSSSAGEYDLSVAGRLEKTNGVSLPPEQQKSDPTDDEDEDDDEAEEDVSDEKYAARHSVLEQEEKKRFRNFVQYPPARRNRTRSEMTCLSATVTTHERTDGGESALALVAEESSLPLRPITPGVYKSHQSSYVQTTSVEDSIDTLQQQLSVRRRTMSFSKRERSGSVVSEDVHNSLIDVGGIEPWPRRTFPLSEEEYKLMREDLPPSCEPVHQRVTRRLAEPSGKVYVGGSAENTDDASAIPSPHPSTGSLSSAGDDPNDPEWVVGEASKRSRTRRIANDDPADSDWMAGDTPRKSKNKR